MIFFAYAEYTFHSFSIESNNKRSKLFKNKATIPAPKDKKLSKEILFVGLKSSL